MGGRRFQGRVQVSQDLEKVQDRVTVHMWLYQERDAITERERLGTGVSGPHPLSTCFDYGPLRQESSQVEKDS